MVSEEIRQAVSEKNGRFSKGFMMGDASVTASVYSEDAVVFPPEGHIVRGREAIEKFWSGVMHPGAKEANLTTLELTGGGEYVHEMGTGVLKIQSGKEAKPIEQHVKYVVVWKRTIDGWMNNWDIWNSSLDS
jgi:ketosteroid isomerase-like protein